MAQKVPFIRKTSLLYVVYNEGGGFRVLGISGLKTRSEKEILLWFSGTKNSILMFIWMVSDRFSMVFCGFDPLGPNFGLRSPFCRNFSEKFRPVTEMFF